VESDRLPDTDTSRRQSISARAILFSVIGTGSLSNNRLPEAAICQTFGMRVAHTFDVNYTRIEPEIEGVQATDSVS
jgi:hypothetical protein